MSVINEQSHDKGKPVLMYGPNMSEGLKFGAKGGLFT
jgi:hypothetical protein